jgi:hypothetical protein
VSETDNIVTLSSAFHLEHISSSNFLIAFANILKKITKDTINYEKLVQSDENIHPFNQYVKEHFLYHIVVTLSLPAETAVEASEAEGSNSYYRVF